MHRAHAVSFAVSFTNLKIGISDVKKQRFCQSEQIRYDKISVAVGDFPLYLCRTVVQKPHFVAFFAKRL